MAFLPLRRRSTVISTFLGLALCALWLLPMAEAWQTQIQIEAKGPVRKIKTRVAPEYPELALKSNITGIARVELTVTPEGAVKEVKELGGNPVLLSALVHAVKQWKYEPAPTESVLEIKAAFLR